MTNSADPDQLASSEANWSGSTLFAKAGYIGGQHDRGSKERPVLYLYLTFKWSENMASEKSWSIA